MNVQYSVLWRICLAVVLATGLLRPQDAPKKLKRRHGAGLSEDFDIRTSGRDFSTRNVLSRRLAAAESFLSGRRSRGGRLEWNEFGLPRILAVQDGSLTARSQDPPERIVRDFLRGRDDLFGSVPDADGLRLVSTDTTAGLTVLQFHQSVNGVDVFEGHVKGVLDGEGKLLQIGAGSLTQANVAGRAVLSPRQAVEAAFHFSSNLAEKKTQSRTHSAPEHILERGLWRDSDPRPTVRFQEEADHLGCCLRDSARNNTLPSVTTRSPPFTPASTRMPDGISSPTVTVRSRNWPSSSPATYTTRVDPIC